MLGANKLILNQTEMNKAVEYYLNQVVFKTACTVVSVEASRQDNVFEIKLMAPKEPTTSELLDLAIRNGTALTKDIA